MTMDVKLRGCNRNDPCPCGSGRKWKRCCGDGPMQDAVEAARAEDRDRRLARLSESDRRYLSDRDRERRQNAALVLRLARAASLLGYR